MNRPLNPLKLDPSRTVTLRRQLLKEVDVIFAGLRDALWSFLVTRNELALDLSVDPKLIGNTKHLLATDNEKIDAFRAWFEKSTQGLGSVGTKTPINPFWKKFVERSYTQGAERAFAEVKKIVPVTKGEVSKLNASKASFMEQFNTKTGKDKVQVLSGRVFSEIKGMTADMNKKMTVALTENMVKGKSPTAIANILSDVLNVSKNRARTIVRTEIVRAQAEGQLDALEELGVTEVAIAVEWLCMANACKLCTSMKTVTLTITQARGAIPRHPNCQCAFKIVPIKQMSTRATLRDAIKASLKASGSGTYKSLSEKSNWSLADQYK